jgi:hypothetical protein
MADSPDILAAGRRLATDLDGQLSPDADLVFRLVDEIERLRPVFRAAVEFRRCYYDDQVSEEISALGALLDAVTAALDGERRG